MSQSENMVNITTWVLKAVTGDCTSSGVHVVIEPTTYDKVWKELDQDKKMVIVGWYHSHPNLGIFLSGTDESNMKSFHYKPYQIAIVIDPIQNLRGTFAWRNGALKRLGNRSIIFSGDHKNYFHKNRKYDDKFSWENENITLEKVYISKDAVKTMEDHTYQGGHYEVGGLLIGKPSIIEDE